MLMLILIGSDFSQLYIPTEQIKTAYILFLCPLMKNPRLPGTDNTKSGFCYTITNNEHKTNTNSMSFVVSNPWERLENNISMNEI